LFEGSFSRSFTEAGWSEWEKEWSSILDKPSEEWDEEAQSNSARVPYRLPDKEMNL
jgi:hypothetical protein